MDRSYLDQDPETERLVQDMMDSKGCGFEEAIYLVALERGEVYGDGDLVSTRRLTPEERRRIGLVHDPDQVMAETLARVAARKQTAGRAEH